MPTLDTVSRARDTASPPLAAEVPDTSLPVKVDTPHLLADTFRAIGVDNYHRWAWDNYQRVVEELCVRLHAKRIVEIGGGRDPLFTVERVERLGVEMTVNDISQGELEVLPKTYQTACFDVAGDISSVAKLRGRYDLAFSRMVFEHVADGRQAWSNLHELLAPGGVALAFIPTLYAVPFIINKLLPDKLAASIVKLLVRQPHRRRRSGIPGALFLVLHRPPAGAHAFGYRLSRGGDPAVLRPRLLRVVPGRPRRQCLVHENGATQRLARAVEPRLYRGAQVAALLPHPSEVAAGRRP